MNHRNLRRGMVGAACLALCTVSSAQTGSGSSSLGAGQVVDLLRARSELLSGERTVQNLDKVSGQLGRVGVTVDPALVEEIHGLLDERATAKVAADRASLTEQIGLQLLRVDERIREALPALMAADVPNDDGGELLVFWKQPEAAAKVEVYRQDVTDDGELLLEATLEDVAAGPVSHIDKNLIRAGHEYLYEIRYLPAGADAGAEAIVLGRTPSARAVGNFFNWNRTALFISVVALSAVVMVFIGAARRGVELNIRKIAGLEAVDEAVGRATEMGRPIMFIPGIQDMNDIQTVAGLIVLGRVARTAAARDATLEVPTSKSLVMTAARETVHASYMDAGRPDGYEEKKIYYTTDEQFGYVAAVTGAMVREKPATCFYMGAFFAESLILAETANMTGSIQIAGTAMPAQLPFFVAACDYTLIGEEFFAASAYLSGEPQQLGSLKGQDVGKLYALALIVIGVLLATAVGIAESETGFLARALDFVSHTLLETANE